MGEGGEGPERAGIADENIHALESLIKRCSETIDLIAVAQIHRHERRCLRSGALDFIVDFLKPAQPGDWIESRTRVERVGGTLAFADCSITVDDREIVRGRAVWVVAG